MEKALEVADYIIYNFGFNGHKSQHRISNLYLQKLMFFLNIIHMNLSKVKYKDPLIVDDKDNQFETWDYGPVIYNVYKDYSKFNGQPITNTVSHFVITIKNNSISGNYESFNNNKNYKFGDFIDKNIGCLLKFKPFQLVNYSHKEPQWIYRRSNQQYYNNQQSYNYWSSRRRHFWQHR